MDSATTSIVLTTRAGEAAGEGALLRAEDFDGLVRSHQKRIYRILFSMLRDADAADSLTQDCFLRAYERRASYRGESRVETWLIRIALNLARDYLRNRRRAFWFLLRWRGANEEVSQGTVDVPDSQPSAERVLLAREQAAAVWTAAAHLPVQQRAIFLLRFAEEMSLEEIAAATELEIGTVKSHLHRALVAVRKSLAESRRT